MVQDDIPEQRASIDDSGTFNGLTEEIWEKCGRITEEIAAWIYLQPNITMKEIAKNISKSQSMVEKTIKKLREVKLLERIGSTKAGHWVINL